MKDKIKHYRIDTTLTFQSYSNMSIEGLSPISRLVESMAVECKIVIVKFLVEIELKK